RCLRLCARRRWRALPVPARHGPRIRFGTRHPRRQAAAGVDRGAGRTAARATRRTRMTTTRPYATLLERCLRQRLLQPLDAELGRLVTRLDGDRDPLPGLATAIASRAVAQGHACIPLPHVGDVLAEAAPEGVAVPSLPSPAA